MESLSPEEFRKRVVCGTEGQGGVGLVLVVFSNLNSSVTV